MLAGGVMPKADAAFSRTNVVYDTTIGWRFVNRLVKERYGVDSMPETAENVAVDFGIEREAQDRMAMAFQHKTLAAQQAGFLDVEIRSGGGPRFLRPFSKHTTSQATQDGGPKESWP
jgi:acetyl-CoA acetyltransferase